MDTIRIQTCTQMLPVPGVQSPGSQLFQQTKVQQVQKWPQSRRLQGDSWSQRKHGRSLVPPMQDSRPWGGLDKLPNKDRDWAGVKEKISSSTSNEKYTVGVGHRWRLRCERQDCSKKKGRNLWTAYRWPVRHHGINDDYHYQDGFPKTYVFCLCNYIYPNDNISTLSI